MLWVGLVVGFLGMAVHVALSMVHDKAVLRIEESVSQIRLPFQLPAVFVVPKYVTLNESVLSRLKYDANMKLKLLKLISALSPSSKNYYNNLNMGHDADEELFLHMIEEYRNCSASLQKCEASIGDAKIQFVCCEYFHLLESELGISHAINSLQIENESSRNKNLTTLLGAQKGTKVSYFSLRMTLVSRNLPQMLNGKAIQSLSSEEVLYLLNVQSGIMSTSSGQTMTISLMVTDMTVDYDVVELKPQDRGCRMPWEVLNGSFYPSYAYSGCVSECRARIMLRLCGCVHVYSPFRGNVQRCNVSGIKCLEENKENILYAKAIGSCNCQIGCNYHFYHRFGEEGKRSAQEAFHLRYYGSHSRLRLRLNNSDLDKFMTVGGVISLFLGPSILSIVEFIFFFTIRFCSYCIAEVRRSREINVI